MQSDPVRSDQAQAMGVLNPEQNEWVAEYVSVSFGVRKCEDLTYFCRKDLLGFGSRKLRWLNDLFFNRGMLTQECQLWKGWSHRSDPLKSKRRGVLESKSHGKTELRCMKTYVIDEATMFMILTRPPSPGIQTNPHQEPLTNFHWLCTIPDTNRPRFYGFDTVNAPTFQEQPATNH